jgi:hypothetical protein
MGRIESSWCWIHGAVKGLVLRLGNWGRASTSTSHGWINWKRLMLVSRSPTCLAEKAFFSSLTRDWMSCRKPAPIDVKRQSGNATSVESQEAAGCDYTSKDPPAERLHEQGSARRAQGQQASAKDSVL